MRQNQNLGVSERKPKTSRYDPQIDYELHLLGAMLVDPKLSDEAARMGLARDDFETPPFGELFARLQALRLAGSMFDESEAAKAIRDSGVSRPEIGLMLEVGGFSRFDFRHHVHRVIESAKRAKLAKMSDKIAELITSEPAESLIEFAESQLDAIRGRKGLEVVWVDELARRMFADKQIEKDISVNTGMFEVDELLGGLRPGDLAILAARTSVGKTALSLQITEHNARRDRGVFFASLEMDEGDVYDRLSSKESGVRLHKLRAGKVALNETDMSALAEAVDSLGELPVAFFHPRAATVQDIVVAVKAARLRHKISLVVVDYISFLRYSDKKLSRHEQIGLICKQLKAAATELKVPFLVLAQLNRMGEGEKPTLAMLRESGSIEEDADQVILLHRKSRESNDGSIIVAKNRHGRCGEVMVDWDGDRMEYKVSLFQHAPETPATTKGGADKPKKSWKPTKTVKPEGEPWTG